MEQDTTPRGRAVAEKATILLLTLPDGSQRMVASRPVGYDYLVYEWLQKHFEVNPKTWFDLADLWCFIRSATQRPAKIGRAERRGLRSAVKGARTYSIKNSLRPVVVKADSQGGITHCKLLRDDSLKEKYGAIISACKDRRMHKAFANRVEGECIQLGTDVEQLDDVIAARNKEAAANAAAE